MGVFPGKMCSDRQKIMVVDRKSQTGQVLLFLAPGLLANAANSNDVPTEFSAE